LTVLLASFLVTGGVLRAVTAIAHGFEGWGWLRLRGAIDLVLGVLIRRELPMSGLRAGWSLPPSARSSKTSRLLRRAEKTFPRQPGWIGWPMPVSDP
jgi:hypothetical protein